MDLLIFALFEMTIELSAQFVVSQTSNACADHNQSFDTHFSPKESNSINITDDNDDDCLFCRR